MGWSSTWAYVHSEQPNRNPGSSGPGWWDSGSVHGPTHEPEDKGANGKAYGTFCLQPSGWCDIYADEGTQHHSLVLHVKESLILGSDDFTWVRGCSNRSDLENAAVCSALHTHSQSTHLNTTGGRRRMDPSFGLNVCVFPHLLCF